MAEFQEVHRQFDRMCWYYQRKRECPMGCPMNGVNISQCRKIAFERPKETEKIVMQWAAEHPVVYPTWREWLIELGIVGFEPDFHALLDQSPTTLMNTVRVYINEKGSNPIPADIAEKLGIEPKEPTL